MAEKRYTRQAAAGLLEQFVKLTGQRLEDVRDKPAFVAKVKRAFAALLRVPIGDLAIKETVARNVGQAAGGTAVVWLQSMGRVLREQVPTIDGLVRVGDFQVEQSRNLFFPAVALSAVAQRHAYRFEIAGEPAGMLQLQLLRLVQHVGPDRLQVCDCGVVFLRSGKRKSCSDRCQKRVYMRRFRAGEAGKE